jgi:hypothetical protein
MGIVPEQYQCDHNGCTVTRSQKVNHWFAVLFEDSGAVHIYDWDAAIKKNNLRKCKHFCGQAHMLHYVSEVTAKKSPPVAEETEA